MASCSNVLDCIDRDPEFRKQLHKRMSVSSEVETRGVCRIITHKRLFDWTQPTNKNRDSSGTGTGFIADIVPSDATEVYIITAHHVVSENVQIRVCFPNMTSEYFEAKLVGCNVDMDVALLSLSDAVFLNRYQKNESPVILTGNSDNIRPLETLTAHGFSLGEAQLQTTKGVLSARVDGPSRLQTDVHVHPGNSGGPLLDGNGHVVGIVTSGRTDATGINFAAPITEAAAVLTRIHTAHRATKTAVSDRMPVLNCSFVKTNRALISNIPDCHGGAFTTGVHPEVEFPQTSHDAASNIEKNMNIVPVNSSVSRILSHLKNLSSLTTTMTARSWNQVLAAIEPDAKTRSLFLQALRNDVLQVGDIVTAIGVNGETYDVDMQMRSKYSFWPDRVDFQAIFDRMECSNTPVRLHIFRGTEKRVVDMPLSQKRNMFRQMHPDVDAVPYLVMAGVFLMPLAQNHVSIFQRDPLYALLARPDTRQLSILLITHILPESPFNDSQSIGVGDVLVAIDDVTVGSIEVANDAWTKACSRTSQVVTLRMRDGSLASATTDQISEANNLIRQTHNSSEYTGFHRSLPHIKHDTTAVRPGYNSAPGVQVEQTNAHQTYRSSAPSTQNVRRADASLLGALGTYDMGFHKPPSAFNVSDVSDLRSNQDYAKATVFGDPTGPDRSTSPTDLSDSSTNLSSVESTRDARSIVKRANSLTKFARSQRQWESATERSSSSSSVEEETDSN
jgi:S1-C subfamily serine protease